jgi:hypothetical protein
MVSFSSCDDSQRLGPTARDADLNPSPKVKPQFLQWNSEDRSGYERSAVKFVWRSSFRSFQNGMYSFGLYLRLSPINGNEWHQKKKRCPTRLEWWNKSKRRYLVDGVDPVF